VEWISEPTLRHPTGAGRLVRVLAFETREPVGFRVTVSSGDRVEVQDFSPRTALRVAPIFGFRADGIHDVTVEVSGETFAFRVETRPLPDVFPILEVLTHEPVRSEPGLTLFRAHNSDGWTYLIAVDALGEVAWYYEARAKWEDLRLLPDGTLLGTAAGDVVHVHTTGEHRRVFTGEEKYHHEAYPGPDGGFFTLMHRAEEVDDYPKSYSCARSQPAQVKDQVIIQADADGTPLREWSLLSVLDPTRIGWGSLDETGLGFDWGHANSVVWLPEEDALVASVRHQDAVVKIDRATGALQWILGTHDNWSAAMAPYLLTPVGEDFAWPFHQHAPDIQGDRLLLFDNGNAGDTPCDGEENVGSVSSRLVIYEIDSTAMDVSQVWSWNALPDGALFANSLGDADWMPTTGNVLGVWGFLWSEGLGDNEDLGRGSRSARLVEVDPDTDEIVWDLNVYSERDHVRRGWTVYRAQRIPSLYPDDP
jgi:hypothetical protein